VSELLAVHLRWLQYVEASVGYPAEIESQWDTARDRLHGILEVLRDAAGTPPEAGKLTIAAIAKRFDCSEKTIRRIAKEGFITLHKPPGTQRGKLYAWSNELDMDKITARIRDK